MTPTTPSYRRSSRTVRLSFRFTADGISLFDRRRLDMEPLASTELEPRDPGEWTGCWLEVQDASGVPRYRRPIPHPLLRRSEGPDEDGAARTVVWTSERGAFALVVPDSPGGELVVFASPTDRPDVPAPAVEILRVPLRETRPTRSDAQETSS